MTLRPADLAAATRRSAPAAARPAPRRPSAPRRPTPSARAASRRARGRAPRPPRPARSSAGSTPNSPPSKPREHVDLAQLAAPQRRGLLDQAVALALAAQHVERAQVVEVEHRDPHGDLAAARAAELARQLLLEHAPRHHAGQLVGERQRLHARRRPACSIATAAWAASSRSTPAGVRQRVERRCQITISTPQTWPSRSTGSNTAERAPVASTSGAASAGWLRASATK